MLLDDTADGNGHHFVDAFVADAIHYALCIVLDNGTDVVAKHLPNTFSQIGIDFALQTRETGEDTKSKNVEGVDFQFNMFYDLVGNRVDEFRVVEHPIEFFRHVVLGIQQQFVNDIIRNCVRQKFLYCLAVLGLSQDEVIDVGVNSSEDFVGQQGFLDGIDFHQILTYIANGLGNAVMAFGYDARCERNLVPKDIMWFERPEDHLDGNLVGKPSDECAKKNRKNVFNHECS